MYVFMRLCAQRQRRKEGGGEGERERERERAEPCIVKKEIPDPWVLTSDHQNVKLLRRVGLCSKLY